MQSTNTIQAKLAYTFSELLTDRLGASETGDKEQDFLYQLLATKTNVEYKALLI